MTQAHCEGRETVTDGIGMAAYTMDSHNCQRLLVKKDGKYIVKNEENVNPEKPDVPLNKNDAFQKVQKRRVQEKR